MTLTLQIQLKIKLKPTIYGLLEQQTKIEMDRSQKLSHTYGRKQIKCPAPGPNIPLYLCMVDRIKTHQHTVFRKNMNSKKAYLADFRLGFLLYSGKERAPYIIEALSHLHNIKIQYDKFKWKRVDYYILFLVDNKIVLVLKKQSKGNQKQKQIRSINVGM